MEFINSANFLGKGSKGDCTTRALAICKGITYDEAEQYLNSKLGKLEGRGIKVSTLTKELSLISKPIIPFKLGVNLKDLPTFTQFKNSIMHLNKTYYIIVNGHALVVKNGVIYGNPDDAKISRKRLWGVYEF